MPGRLTPFQRLTGPDGLPTAAARLGVVALMVAAAAIGYAAGPDGEDPAPRTKPSIAISRLAGDLPIAARAPRPALAAAPAIPAIRSGSVRRRPAPEPAPTAEPIATATAAPTPDPAVDVPVATVAPAPPPATPAPAAPRRPSPPPPPPTETFDSSG